MCEIVICNCREVRNNIITLTHCDIIPVGDFFIRVWMYASTPRGGLKGSYYNIVKKALKLFCPILKGHQMDSSIPKGYL